MVYYWKDKTNDQMVFLSKLGRRDTSEDTWHKSRSKVADVLVDMGVDKGMVELVVVMGSVYQVTVNSKLDTLRVHESCIKQIHENIDLVGIQFKSADDDGR